mgnify:FL=1
MGKHDLQVSSSHRSVIVPEVMSPATTGTGGGSVSESTFSQADRGEMAKAAVSGIIDISKTIAGIYEIKAKSQAEVAAIKADIERIAADAKAYVDKRKADSEEWHSRFDKAMAFVKAQLNDHPDWSDELKAKVIDVILKAMDGDK